MGSHVFRNRHEAGQLLAGRLAHYCGRDDVVVLALPRGGVPVAYEVARELQAPLDVYVVRKLGAPNYPELAVGAVATGGVLVTNDDALRAEGVDAQALEQIAETERRELQRREKTYRDGWAPADLAGKTVIVVDDGLATGATMNAALAGIRSQSPARVIAAVPTAPQDTCRELTRRADEVICATTPKPFLAVGGSYRDFDQTSDDEVRRLLAAAGRQLRAADPPVDDLALIRQRGSRRRATR